MTVRSQFVGASGDGGVRTGGLVVGMVAVAVAVAFIHSRALAQETIAPDLYEVIDVGAHAYPPGVWSGASPGINSHHDVVWTAPSGLTTHAMVRFHCPRFGYAMGEVVDLTLAAGLSGLGAATDINDAGVVVGTQSSDADQGPAFVWDTSRSTGGGGWTHGLPSLQSDQSGPGIAVGLDDSTPVTLVGSASTDAYCFPPLFRARGAFGGFYDRASSSVVVHDLGAYGYFELVGPFESIACDVGSGSLVAGHQPRCEGLAGDELEVYGLVWSSPVSPAWERLGGSTCIVPADALYGLNDAGMLVGRIGSCEVDCGDSGAEDCEVHAAVWNSPTSAPTDLARLSTSGSIGVVGPDSRANGISNSADVIVAVGTTEDGDAAVRWTRDAEAEWHARRANDLVSPLWGWELQEATDVSDDGWITGYGLIGTERRTFIMKPILCPADINGDGEVDGTDAALLFSAWDSQSAEDARADLSRNGRIDGGDLLEVLAAWGSSCPPETCGPAVVEVGLAMRWRCEDAAHCALQMSGFLGAAEFAAWRRETPCAERMPTEECLVSCFRAKMEESQP